MDIKITGKNLEVPDDLEQYAESKLAKLKKFSGRIQSAQVNLMDQASKDPRKAFRAEMVLHVPGTVLTAKDEAQSFYIALDGAMDKIVRQLKKNKTKRIDKTRESLSKTKPAAVADKVREDEGNDNGIEVRHFTLKPMSVEEAILQMENSGYGFFLFATENDQVNCVFKRTEGGYGLLLPESESVG